MSRPSEPVEPSPPPSVSEAAGTPLSAAEGKNAIDEKDEIEGNETRQRDGTDGGHGTGGGVATVEGGGASDGDAEKEWLRLHPLTPFLLFVRRLLSFALPIIAIFFIRPQSSWIVFFILSAAIGTIAGFLHYLHFRYRLDRDEIVVRQGIFRRTERNVPYSKIQNLDLTRDLIDRVSGLSKLSLETASGTEPEAVFAWIRPEQVEEIRRKVLAARSSVPAVPGALSTDALPPNAEAADHDRGGLNRGMSDRSVSERGMSDRGMSDRGVSDRGVSDRGVSDRGVSGRGVSDPGPSGGRLAPDLVSAGSQFDASGAMDDGRTKVVHKVPLADLLLLGLFSLRGLAIFGLALGLAFEFDLFITDVEDARSVFEFLSGLGGPPAITYGGAAIALLFVITLASIVLTIVEFYGFTLSSAGAELRNRYGLFTQRTGTIPRGRIQILEVQSPVHLRRFRRLRLRAGTAGGSTEGGAGRTWLVPVFKEDDLTPILEEVQPETPMDRRDWLPVHPGTTSRLRRRAIYWSWIATVIGVLLWGRWGALAMTLLPFGWFYAKRVAEHLAYSQSEDAIYARRGWLRRVTQVVKLNRIQAAEVIEKPFDRKWGMATLRIDTASPTGGRLEVPYLPQEEALRLQRELIREANRRRFKW